MIVAGWASIAAAEEGGLGGSGPPAPIIRTGGIGKIQRIQGDDIVIDDRLYTLKSDFRDRFGWGNSPASENEINAPRSPRPLRDFFDRITRLR